MSWGLQGSCGGFLVGVATQRVVFGKHCFLSLKTKQHPEICRCLGLRKSAAIWMLSESRISEDLTNIYIFKSGSPHFVGMGYNQCDNPGWVEY